MEHLCAGYASSWEITLHEGKGGIKQHCYGCCALPAPSPLRLALWWAGFALLSLIAFVEQQGPDVRAGGSMLPCSQETLLCSPPFWPLAFWSDRLCNRQVHQYGHKEGWQDGSSLSFCSSWLFSWLQTLVAVGNNASERQMGLTCP